MQRAYSLTDMELKTAIFEYLSKRRHLLSGDVVEDFDVQSDKILTTFRTQKVFLSEPPALPLRK